MQKQVHEVRERVGDGKAVIAVSGGVDSTVCAVLTHRAVGDRLVAAFIDDELMLEGEIWQVSIRSHWDTDVAGTGGGFVRGDIDVVKVF